MTAARVEGDRLVLLAKIHVARKQMAMQEADYRAVLLRIAGAESARDLAPPAIVLVLEEFERLGWQPRAGTRRDRRPHVRKIWAIWADLKPLLDDADDQVLRAFIRRQTRNTKTPEGIGAPEWLDGVTANKVIEGLKGWLARLQAKRAVR